MSGTRGQLLVIDDEEDIREMLEFVLSREGFVVVTVDGGLAAVELVQKRRFDVAITDMKMPGMDGLETLAALKKLDPAIEVIVVTGYASEQTAAECVRRGAYGYLRSHSRSMICARSSSRRCRTASQRRRRPPSIEPQSPCARRAARISRSRRRRRSPARVANGWDFPVHSPLRRC